MPESDTLADLHAGLVVVGAGPAGLAAALAAAQAGVDVTLLDGAPLKVWTAAIMASRVRSAVWMAESSDTR